MSAQPHGWRPYEMGSGLRERPAEEGAEEEAESRGVLPLVPGDYGEPRKDPPRALRGTGLCCPLDLGRLVSRTGRECISVVSSPPTVVPR